MRINHNLAAINTYRQLTLNNNSGSKSLEKLSSGMRINKAGDDAAGLAISEKMRSQIKGLNQASRNAQDGISLIQTAEGAMNEVHSILQRVRELAVQTANDTNVTADRVAIAQETHQLIAEIDRIAADTEFNTKKLLDGSYSTTPLTLQIGANQGQALDINIANIGASALGINHLPFAHIDSVETDGDYYAYSYSSVWHYYHYDNFHTDAASSITTVSNAITKLSTERSKLGAYQNRIEHTINNLEASAENMTAAESRIRDADMAKEMMEFTKNNILSQAAQAMLTQANQQPQNVLQLLQGG